MVYNNSWLTDESLQIYFDIIPSRLLPSSKKVHILNPANCNALKFSPDVSELLDPFYLKDKNYIIIAVSYSVETNQEGGSHWSLFEFSKSSSTFYYYDSSRLNINFESTTKMRIMIANHLDLGLPSNYEFVKLNGPIQNIGFDFGITLFCHCMDCS